MANEPKTKKPRAAAAKAAAPALETEYASRLVDPFETLYMGLVRANDPLLLEKGGASNGAELYKDLKRDPKVYSALQKRKRSVISAPFQVEPVEKSERGQADAQEVLNILKRFPFDRLCSELLEATLMGTGINETVFTVRNGQYEVARAPKRATRRFVYVQEDASKPPQLRMLKRENMLTGEALPERTFIVHRFEPDDDNPWGTGLGLYLYWSVFFKRKAKISWNKGNDRAGNPVPWGKHPKNAGPTEKNTLFSALKALANDGVVMTPEGTLIEMLESKIASGGFSSHRELCEYCDDEIDAVVLSQEARGKAGGALGAASKERSGGLMEQAQSDWDMLAATLNDTLIKWLCELNGFVPCLVSRVIKEEEDLKATSEVDKNVTEMGFQLSEEGVRAKYGEHWNRKAEPPPAPPAPPGGAALPPPGAPPAPGAPAAAPSPKPSPAPAPGGANFAEPGTQSGQDAIDAAIAAVSDAELQEALQGIFEPLLAAIEAADTFEDALAAAEAAYPRMDKAKLQSFLARAMFGAEVLARQEGG